MVLGDNRKVEPALPEMAVISAHSRTVATLLVSIVAATAFLTASRSARADVRVALVVGNSNYQYVSRLGNPSNDAKLIAKTLRDLGFTLVGGGARLDLNKTQFDRAVQNFGDAAQGADVALFYYAGHGLSARGVNYLVPVDAHIGKESDVDFQMLGADKVLREMEDAHARLNLVILDACRDNPFLNLGARGIEGGLARMQAPEGTLISFATQPGHVALDGNGRDSPFTEALAETIRKPGLDIFRTFNEVGLRVAAETGGEQQPWLSLSPITGDFYFAGAPKPTAPTFDPLVVMQRDYAAAEGVATQEGWDTFLKAHPKGYLADLARAQRDKLVTEKRGKASALEQARKEAEAMVERAAAEKAALEAAAKVAATDRMRREAETKAARLAADRARKAADQEKAKSEAEAKDAQAALEDAKRQAAAAKAAEQAAEKTAQQAVAALESERATREKEIKTAALAPASGRPSTAVPAATMDPAEIVQLVKIHLHQVGCDPGDVNGVWDDGARKALVQFNKYAGTKLEVKTASLNTLDAVRAVNKRVCPLVCGRGTRREGDQCVAITCKHGFELSAIGICERAKSLHEANLPLHAEHKSSRTTPAGRIVLGSPEHLRLRSECKNGDFAACRTLCAAGAHGACRKLGRRYGHHGNGHHQLENIGRIE
jgi:uncharacterized caspase-like protein